jgi:hypothetical protein
MLGTYMAWDSASGPPPDRQHLGTALLIAQVWVFCTALQLIALLMLINSIGRNQEARYAFLAENAPVVSKKPREAVVSMPEFPADWNEPGKES